MIRAALLLTLALSGCTSLDLGRPFGEVDTAAPQGEVSRVWEQAAGAAFGPSAAVVTRDFVVMGTRQGEIVVMESATGRLRGSVSLGKSVEGRFAVSGDGRMVYVPTAEADGGVVAYDVAEGVKRWRWEGGGIQGGVVQIGTVLVTATRAGATVGIDAASGEELWRRQATPGAQIHAAPTVVATSVVVVDDRGQAVALDPVTGTERWTADLGAPVYASPSAAGDLFISTTRGRVARLDAQTGQAVWAVDDPATVRASSPLVVGDQVVVGFSDGTVRALDLDTGAERWRTDVGGVVSGRPAFADGRVWVGTMDNQLVALDADGGSRMWATKLRGRVKSDVFIGGGRVFALVEPGHVVAFGTPQ